MIPDLRQRSREPEEMDLLDSDQGKLFRTLDQFRSVNRLLSRVRGPLKQHLFPLLSREEESHLLDIGAGGCDIPVWLLEQAKRRGLRLRITAIDSDPRVIQHARKLHAQVEGLEIMEANALDLEAPGPFDYVFANHFLHHLDDDQIQQVLTQTHRLAKKGYLFSDLKRSRFSYAAFSLVGRIYRNSFTREDGLLSIRKGFTVGEFQDMAPSPGCKIRQAFPGRLYLFSGSTGNITTWVAD